MATLNRQVTGAEPVTGSMTKKSLPCIVCDKELDNVTDNNDIVNQPYEGTAFSTHGHYGSTVFDPVIGTQRLTITVCDACLVAKAATHVLEVIPHVIPPQHFDYIVWDPDADE